LGHVLPIRRIVAGGVVACELLMGSADKVFFGGGTVDDAAKTKFRWNGRR
jgi:hypothetical protein